ncbi:hypothetical protein KL930_002345 [Ogataea haglerorum]|uniref:Uncharacterized protein n=1 Tax=Ogataea haglerorum TaxID=1937702 RepID=A0AAN6D749_9ASCO|nr:uncharacterized protein KL911_000049 [Ogataea haglerorum]KAG7698868.1 hypothetical protein KL915_001160 [Ogataea haglerorum]KAG7709910.1 hypothetical protein KL914_000820 [Ogataea haglerorum]KAG7711310.1 hypothetical protein KL950_001276 [Ogataea haglerorum]KAG7720607.1 hypothetical protein KL913_001507 [Ogataea haglerorum]KAG7720993.1 hypothetical protein KL949_001865 [Ogataea haglerorum]
MPPHRKRGRPPNAFYEQRGLTPPSRQSHNREQPPPPPREPQPPVNIFSHPVYSLPIPPPNSVESQLLNDEVDVFSFRQSAAFKFKLNNELLENVLSKFVPFTKIVPPSSFPVCLVNGKPVGAENAPSEEEIKQSFEKPTAADSHCGDLRVMKLKQEHQRKLIEQLESETINEDIDERFADETEKISLLSDTFQEYDVTKLDQFKSMVDSITDDLKAKFNIEIQDDELFKQRRLKFEQRKCTLEEYQQARELILRRRKEAEDRKLRLEQELAEKKRQEEEFMQKQRQEEEQRRAQEAQNRRTEETSAMSVPNAAPAQQEMLGEAHFDDPFTTGAQNGNFEFDNNLLFAGSDDLIMGDDGAFGALDDQVFLDNLHGNLE